MFRRLLLCLPLILAVTLSAQSVRWEPAGGTLAMNQVSDLTLIFDQCEPKGDVTLPTVDGLDTGSPSRSEQNSFSIINGNASRTLTVSLTYQIRPTTKQTITIPSFEVATTKGKVRVPSATFDIGEATVGQSNLSLDAVALSKFTTPDEVWAGEVFPLRYTLNVARRYFYQLGSDLDWTPAPLSIEPWEKPELMSATFNGEERVSVLYKTRALVKTPGTITLPVAKQLVNLATGTSAFSVFSRPNLEQFSISSKPATLVVKPLPLPAPADFTGAVGQFTLDSKVVPATATVGEPITWTLTLAGTGNWPDLGGLPSRSVSRDFRIVQPQAKRTNKDNALFEASLAEDIVLVPTKPGPYTLGPVTLSYFDPKTGTYQTLKTEPVTITITGAAPIQETGAQTPQTGKPSADQPEARAPKSEISAPASIPRDPLPYASSAPSPLASSSLLVVLLAAVLCPLIVWIVLALNRARLTDPRLPRRTARTRLSSTLASLRPTSSPEQILALLQQWQRDVAVLWQFDLAVPTAESFKSATGNPAQADAWAVLWAESDRVLYRADAQLPEDWVSRATEALASKHVPGFSALQLFLPRNLLPCIVALLISSLLLSPSTFAADARASYAKGDFAAAESSWNDAIEAAPTDWTTRHNLALALVQQNRWSEASGHALAAFVQQPQNPAVLWNLEFTLKGAGLHPSEVMPLLDTDPLHALARLASPAIWQWLLIAAVWLVALSLGFWLWLAYGHRNRLKPAAWVLLGLSLAVALASAASLHLYGPLADARAVFVAKPTTLRSIPTELDAPQKSSALTAGLIATTDKNFLGWQRLVFPNGQTGWVRRTDIVPLWR